MTGSVEEWAVRNSPSRCQLDLRGRPEQGRAGPSYQDGRDLETL
jgi:hypothetical protein